MATAINVCQKEPLDSLRKQGAAKGREQLPTIKVWGASNSIAMMTEES
jgi:hypothetical protein